MFFFELGRAPASQGRHITGFASLGASHASPLHAPHAKTSHPMENLVSHRVRGFYASLSVSPTYFSITNLPLANNLPSALTRR
jgi:hypothetical protein